MPIIKSAKKRVKIAEKKTIRNRKEKDILKDSIKEFEKIVDTGNLEEAQAQLKETIKVIDKATNKKILHKNNAARKKSRLTKMLSKIG